MTSTEPRPIPSRIYMTIYRILLGQTARITVDTETIVAAYKAGDPVLRQRIVDDLGEHRLWALLHHDEHGPYETQGPGRRRQLPIVRVW